MGQLPKKILTKLVDLPKISKMHWNPIAHCSSRNAHEFCCILHEFVHELWLTVNKVIVLLLKNVYFRTGSYAGLYEREVF